VFEKYNAMGYQFQFQEEPSGHFSNRWLTCLLIDPEKNLGLSSQAIRLAFEKENIETRPLWKPLHQQPIFENCISYTNGVSDLLFEQGICLPSGSNLTNEAFDRIFNCFDALLEQNAQCGTVAI
jgi:dTDP-4-amino-4,6-dideoxygalactose transaminase